MIIGLTGRYCAGKNHIAAILEKRGFPVLDVDKLGYHALEMEKQAVFAKFGYELQKNDGALDRRLLGQKVFGRPDKLAALEEIVHPVVNRMTCEWIQSALTPNCVINAALLHKSSVFNKLEKIIIVSAPFFTRLLRARRRDKLTLTQILKRFASQKDFNTQYLSINAEIYRIENPAFSCCGIIGSSNQKLECRIDKIIEGIR